MNLHTLIPLAAALLASVPPAAAQDWTPAQERRLTPDYQRCADAAAGAMLPLIDCAQAEHQLQDARLNQAYRMVMTRLGPDRRATLRTAQRAWIKQRDRKCRAAWTAAGGGQNSDLEQASCLLHETLARTMALETYR